MTRADLSLAVWGIMRKIQWPQTFTHEQAKRAVESIFSCMKQALGEHDEVVVRRFGRFKIQFKVERVGLNPKTGKHHVVSARTVVKFQPGTTLRRAVNNEKPKFS